MERNRELKIHIPTRDRTVHTKEEMQKDRDTERVKSREREFPAAQWLGLALSLSRSPGSIPGQGTKILQATRCGQRQRNGRERL